MEPRPCTYCGLAAETIDHTIPQCIVKAAGDAGVDLSSLSRVRYLVVPACRECNSLLGSRVFPTLAARRAWVKGELKRRHRADLKMPSWSDAEIADMGPVAQIDIRAGLRRRDLIRARLAWAGNGEAAESFEAGYRLQLETIKRGLNGGRSGD